MATKAGYILAVAIAGLIAAPADAGQGKKNKEPLRAKILQRFDKNGNSQLDPDEKAAAMAERQKHRQGKAKGAGNGGFKGRILQRFDANGNGQLDPDEKAAAMAALQKHRHGHRGQGRQSLKFPGGQRTGRHRAAGFRRAKR